MKKRLSVLVLALAMILTMSISVFADDTTKPAAGDNAKAASAAKLVKYLKKGDGVALPNATFTFTFAPQPKQTTDVDTGQKDDNNQPIIKHNTSAEPGDYPQKNGSTTITYEMSASALTTPAETASANNTGDVEKAVAISDIFTGFDEGKGFASAGEYIYVVSETGVLTDDSDAKTTEKLTNDTQTYTLRIYVKNTQDGKGTEIDKVTVENSKGEKVDPTDEDVTPDSTATPPETYGPDYKANGFTFTNKYDVEVKTPEGEDPTNPNNPTNPTYVGFGVTKQVAGAYASKTKEFTYSVKIDKPAGAPADVTTGTYRKIGGTDTSFTYGTAFEVTLKHNENFGITDMLLGSHVTITEAGAEHYTPAVSGLISANATVGKPCGNSTAIAVGSENKGQNAAYVNTMNDEDAPTPTGIIISNLPYILLIGLALGGIVLFSRKRRYE